MNHYANLEAILQHMKDDVDKFEGGNNAAGTRLRKQIQNLKKACNDMRVSIQEVKAGRKAK